MKIELPPELFPNNETEKKFALRMIQFIALETPHRTSERLTPYKKLWGKHLMGMGFRQHDIAAVMRVNQGRLSETKRGKAS